MKGCLLDIHYFVNHQKVQVRGVVRLLITVCPRQAAALNWILMVCPEQQDVR